MMLAVTLRGLGLAVVDLRLRVSDTAMKVLVSCRGETGMAASVTRRARSAAWTEP